MHVTAHLDINVVAVETTDSVTVMLDLDAPQAVHASVPRPEHTAVVVLDRSGSMGGERLEAAKRALADLVGRLEDRDHFGLVTFDHEAQVVIPAGRVGDLGRDRLRSDIGAISAGGSTDMSSGYLRGLQEARRVATETGATLVLLSDGHANVGVTDPAQLREVAARAASQGITTSTIGIGLGYDEAILVEMATGGTGNHAFAKGADDASVAVAAELEGLLSKSVQAASLLIEPSGDVSAVAILNDVPSHAVEGGVLVELGDFYDGEHRCLTMTIDVPAMAGLGLAEVARLTLIYVEVAALQEVRVTVPVSVNVVPLDVARGRVPAPEVVREKLFLATQSAKRQVEMALRAGDFESAGEHLKDAASAITIADPTIIDAQLRTELDWLQRTAEMLNEGDGDREVNGAYLSRRVSSDRSRKSRGYKSRTQGGEVHVDDANEPNRPSGR